LNIVSCIIFRVKQTLQIPTFDSD